MTPNNDEERSLLALPNGGDLSWRLNFESFQLGPEHTLKKPPRGLHDCLGVLGDFAVTFGW